MDLNILVNESLKKIKEEGYVEEVVEARIKKTIEEIINDLFKEWGSFGKNLKEELGNNLKVNLQKLDIASYNHMVNNAVKESLDNILHVQGVEKMKERLEKILVSAKDEYKLSELIKLMKDNESRMGEEHYGGSISLHFDEHSTLTFVRFDPETNVKEYRCKYCLAIDNETNRVKYIEIDENQFDNKVIMGGLHGLDQVLFGIYTNGARVIIDEDEVEYEYDYEYED